MLTLWIQHHLVRSSMKTMRSMKSSSSLEKREFIKERDNSLHQARKKENFHQGEIRFWESIKLCEKREAHFKKKRRRERERSECKNFHQVVREYWFIKRHETWDSMKDHSSWEGWAKMLIRQKQNLIKLRKRRKRKSKIHLIINK